MIDDYDDDEPEDELHTRKGKFLQVEAVDDGYSETALNGSKTEYRPNLQPSEICIEGIALHATSNLASGTVRPMLTGQTSTKFRSIGTEGSYPEFNVTISPEIAHGTAIVRRVYDEGGHALLGGGMSVGLSDETIRALGEILPGKLRISGMEKGRFYTSDAADGTILLDYWRDHVVPSDDASKVIAEWQFTFDKVTLSPEGYEGGWLGNAFHASSNSQRYVSGDIGIRFADDHPLRQAIEDLTRNLPQVTKSINFALLIIAAALVYLAYKAS